MVKITADNRTLKDYYVCDSFGTIIPYVVSFDPDTEEVTMCLTGMTECNKKRSIKSVKGNAPIIVTVKVPGVKLLDRSSVKTVDSKIRF